MIWGQAIWGAVVAGLLGFTFRRAWRWEHGGEADVLFAEKNGKETYVLVPPTVLVWILLGFLGIFLWQYGPRDGLVRFAALAADVLLLLCVYYLLLLLLLPLLRGRFSARACAVLWLVPAILSWQINALISTVPLPRMTIYVPRSALPAAGGVWLAGFLGVGGYYLITHFRFSRWVRRHSEPEREEEVLDVWKRLREELEYRRPVRLLRADVPAPFSMGRTKRSRCTVLPRRSYSPEELGMIFRHELHHLQRCDVDTKVFLNQCRALCWFDPLVWIAVRKAAEDLERSCDEIVTEGMDEAGRRTYADLLLDSAAPAQGCTTCLSAAAGTLRYRLKSVMEPRRRPLGTLVLMAALFLCVMCFGLVSFTDMRGSFAPLLLTPDTEIRYISDSLYAGQTIRWDDDALREALGGIELEHIAGARRPVVRGRFITLLLPGARLVTLTDTAVVVTDNRGHISSFDCWLIRGGLDWEALRACYLPPPSSPD